MRTSFVEGTLSRHQFGGGRALISLHKGLSVWYLLLGAFTATVAVIKIKGPCKATPLRLQPVTNPPACEAFSLLQQR